MSKQRTERAVQHQEAISKFSKFARARLVFHDNLCVPMMVLWREYQSWAEDALDAEKFVKCLLEAGVYIEDKGRGRLKRVALGVGIKPR